ncbi:MAG: hypothetical protein OEY56_07865 [Cyclobacteriaceae bacterium]|nr:hypothetical protein [Cyclobacteriaceae bacterium]
MILSNKNTLQRLLVVIPLMFLLLGCETYSDGGLIGKTEKRVTGKTWILDKYYLDGIDETSSLIISNLTENYNENGTYLREYTDKNGDPVSESGTWQFDTDKQLFNISGVGSMEITVQTGTVSSSDYFILRMVKDELVYNYDNGSSNHEFHFIAN